MRGWCLPPRRRAPDTRRRFGRAVPTPGSRRNVVPGRRFRPVGPSCRRRTSRRARSPPRRGPGHRCLWTARSTPRRVGTVPRCRWPTGTSGLAGTSTPGSSAATRRVGRRGAESRPAPAWPAPSSARSRVDGLRTRLRRTPATPGKGRRDARRHTRADPVKPGPRGWGRGCRSPPAWTVPACPVPASAPRRNHGSPRRPRRGSPAWSPGSPAASVLPAGNETARRAPGSPTVLEHLAARRQLLVELHHAAGDVEHDAGLPLADSDNANRGTFSAAEKFVGAPRGPHARLALTARQHPSRRTRLRIRVEHTAHQLDPPRPQPQRRQRASALRDADELLAEHREPGRTGRPRAEGQRTWLNRSLGPHLHDRLQTWRSQSATRTFQPTNTAMTTPTKFCEVASSK